MSSKTRKRKNTRLRARARAQTTSAMSDLVVPRAPRAGRDALCRVIIRASVNDVNTGGTGQQGFSFYLDYPTYYRNPANTVAQCANVATSYANEFKTFDEYRVLSLRLRYVPNFQSHADSTASVSIDPTLLTSQDYDDSSLLTGITKAFNSQDKSFSVSTVWGQDPKLLSFMSQTDAYDKMKWLNTAAPSPSAPDAIAPGSFATIKVYRNGYGAANQIVGIYIAEWDVVLRGISNVQ
jgi:hypothetical protein